jgi:hypothetical protein
VSAPFPITTEQQDDDPIRVVLDLDALAADDTDECDSHSLALTPDRAEALAAELQARATDIRQGSPAEIHFIHLEGDPHS